jgi:predicted site-specific integrase-resolvase
MLTYSVPYAASIVGVSRPTLDAWIKAGVVKPTGYHNAKPAFTQRDIWQVRKAVARRAAARVALSLR